MGDKEDMTHIWGLACTHAVEKPILKMKGNLLICGNMNEAR